MNKKSLLGFGGPDYESAVEKLQRAANLYKMDKSYERAANTFSLAADCLMKLERKA